MDNVKVGLIEVEFELTSLDEFFEGMPLPTVKLAFLDPSIITFEDFVGFPSEEVTLSHYQIPTWSGLDIAFPDSK